MSIDPTAELKELRQRYPWPQIQPDFFPIRWSLDGGGRWMVEQRIRERKLRIILEIGSFLGGSVEQWLQIDPNLIVIAVDPWPECDIADYARRSGRSEEEATQLERPDGFYQTFLSNFWNQRDRVIPVREYSPAVLHELALLGLRPDLIYLDCDKSGTEIELCHKLFPNALMTGDDWQWQNEAGEFPIREPVEAFCKQHDRYLKTENATWIIDDQPPSLSFRFRTLRRSIKQRFKDRKASRAA
ncbi:MAG: hypothetical protein AAF664_22485 [Planctomycetota bacterium]